jgi:hypothetical protein
MIDRDFNFHPRLQKIHLILGLLLAAAYAEKKINLEDIERDNLRSENKAKTESIQTDETKYAAKPNVYQQQYQIPSQYNGLDTQSESYISAQPLQNIKYSVRRSISSSIN